MQMALKFPVACEPQTANDADNGRGISLKPGGHGAYAEQHVLTGMFQDRPNDFLALDAEKIDTLS
jgi:hypothetical protein